MMPDEKKDGLLPEADPEAMKRFKATHPWLRRDEVAVYQEFAELALAAEGETVEVHVDLALEALGLMRAKRSRGQPRKLEKTLHLLWARRRKAELVESGMSAGEADEQAATETHSRMEKAGLSPPGVDTIIDQMHRPGRY